MSRLAEALATPGRLVLLAFFVVVAPVLVFGEVSASDARDRQRANTHVAATGLAERSSELISLQIAQVATQVASLTGDPELQSAIESEDRTSLAVLLRSRKSALTPDVLRLFALDVGKSALLAQAPFDDLLVGVSYARADFVELIATASPHAYVVSAAYELTTPGIGPAVVIASPMRGPTGLAAGVLAAELDLSRARTWFAPVLADGDDAYLIDGSGRVLAQAVRPEMGPLTADLRGLTLSGAMANA
ncbi:MAG: cache domain-containing protein, partial [Chloroflexota bacterium]